MIDPFADATAVADAVLYEGYLLYPYRASSEKNRMRFQFGVLVPPAAEEITGEHATAQTQCLCEPRAGATLSIRLRFLHLRTRTVEASTVDGFRPVERLTVADEEYLTWDEAVERQVDASLPIADLLAGEVSVPFEIPASMECETLTAGAEVAGQVVRRCAAIAGTIRLVAVELDGPSRCVRITLLVANATGIGEVWSRDDALPSSMLGVHTLVALDAGGFLSLTDPPEWAGMAAAACVNVRTWPVLVGHPDEPQVMLSSPIILGDFPSVAPESPGPLFDGTEIDEILTLRTMTLTEAEKREARATDARARTVLDRIDAMPPEMLDRLHGTVRYLRQVTGSGSVPGLSEPATPWWDPAADASVDPDTDHIVVDGVRIAKGSRVRLTPRRSGTDAQDMFLSGLAATVQAVLHDVDGDPHIAVTIDDDPAAELQHIQGRYRYFAPTEIKPAEFEQAEFEQAEFEQAEPSQAIS
jgi:hypothetical protein